MSFAFFHGDPVTVLFIPGLVALGVGVAVFVTTALLFKSSRTYKKLPAFYFALAYLIPVAMLLVLLAVSSPRSGLSFMSFGSSFLLTLPWSALGHWALDSLTPGSRIHDSVAVLVVSAGVNTVIFYCVGIVPRVLKRGRHVDKPFQ